MTTPQPNYTTCIKTFLELNTHADLAALYTADHEVQVNVDQDGGERVSDEFTGTRWQAWTDGLTKWHPVRIPRHANTETPEDNDGPMGWSIDDHALGIGMTGWNFRAKLSEWFGFDFDAISGHAEVHAAKLTEAQLAEVREAACAVPWVTVRRSTSGSGLHLYVALDPPVPTATHTEHAALARAVLAKMSGVTGFDFTTRADTCVPADTWTMTSEGPRRVGQVVGRACDLLVHGRAFASDGFFPTGEKAVYEVVTKQGHRFRATADHLMRVNLVEETRDRRSEDTWKKVGDLGPGDRLVLHAHRGVSWPGEGTRDEGYLLGWLFADGSLSEHQPHWKSGHLAGYMRNSLAFYPPKHCLIEPTLARFEVRPAGSYCPQQDCWRFSSREIEALRLRFGVDASKAITPEMEMASSEFTCGFLSAFFDADGCPNKDESGIELTQSDFPRILGIQRMLLRLGINSSVSLEREAGSGLIKGRVVQLEAKYALRVGRENVHVFTERIGFEHPEKARIHRESVEAATSGPKKVLARERFHAVVGSISSVGARPVFDVRVPGPRAFDANGFYAHNCGGNMWIWHRKMRGTEGLTLLKRGEPLRDVPGDWREHVPVVSGRRRKTTPGFVPPTGDGEKEFETLSGQRNRVALDGEHRRLIDWLGGHGFVALWNPDHHMLITHTFGLREAHAALGFRGSFTTLSTGTNPGEQNCFAFPGRKGTWTVRRFSPGVAETPAWDRDSSGWTRCQFNRDPSLRDAARQAEAAEDTNGGFVFWKASDAIEAARALGAEVRLPYWAEPREATLKELPDGRLLCEVKAEKIDPAEGMRGWVHKRGVWRRIFHARPVEAEVPDHSGDDDIARHLVTETNDDHGWVMRVEDEWNSEPLVHVRSALKGSFGLDTAAIEALVGGSVVRPWKLVSRPFQPEYPGDRTWNRDAPQFRVAPSQDSDSLSYPSWQAILGHVGRGIDEGVRENTWCVAHGVASGADYLKCWIASLFQMPREPLPYLFLYSPEQSTGKSILHEALALLVTHGVERADHALTSLAGFNAELRKAILCVVEETDLKKSKVAYNRIKDWVTSPKFQVHMKGETPYTVPNTTHWIQCSNDRYACPVFEGDTRITMIRVSPLGSGLSIPKSQLMRLLEKEAPDFLSAVLNLELPPTGDRLNIPVIETADKRDVQESNRSPLEAFLAQFTHYVPGVMIPVGEFYEAFRSKADPSDVIEWSKQRVSREMPVHHPKGRNSSGLSRCYGNLSWEPPPRGVPPRPRLVARGDYLVPDGHEA